MLCPRALSMRKIIARRLTCAWIFTDMGIMGIPCHATMHSLAVPKEIVNLFQCW